MFIENIAKCFKYNKKKSLHKIYTKSKIPHLWLFTDDIKTQNFQKFLAKIPQNSGIVIRNYLSEDRLKIIESIRRNSKRKNLTLLIGEKSNRIRDISGLHLPKWYYQKRKINKKQILSISAHGIIDKRRIINSKADLIFLSPIFRTSSHPNSRPLGTIKFGLIARQFSKPVIALGGINKNNIKKLKNLPIEGVAGIDFLK